MRVGCSHRVKEKSHELQHVRDVGSRGRALTNQTVRLVEGKITYIDAQGQPIKLEDSRSEPAVKFATYGSDRLDPGQEATQSLDVEFPAEALKTKKLKEIHLEFAYIPSPYRAETVNFAVSIGSTSCAVFPAMSSERRVPAR